ncbi:hypothetical protein DTO271G3_8792 [Paecilomyces variotii]|nr:hypothetical protein DTO271G3_8792 [Paecilomyces variotii]
MNSQRRWGRPPKYQNTEEQKEARQQRRRQQPQQQQQQEQNTNQSTRLPLAPQALPAFHSTTLAWDVQQNPTDPPPLVYPDKDIFGYLTQTLQETTLQEDQEEETAAVEEEEEEMEDIQIMEPLDQDDWRSNLTTFLPPATLYESRDPSPLPSPEPLLPPPSINLDRDTVATKDPYSISFDIDSVIGFAIDLAVARCGLRWTTVRSPVSSLKQSLHLNPLRVRFQNPETGRFYHTLSPIHRIPHLPLGQLAGFKDVELFIIFPNLYNPKRKHWVITNNKYSTWMDKIFLPALTRTCPESILQHLPASTEHAQLQGTAQSAKGHRQHTQHSRVQVLHFVLQSNNLSGLWQSILLKIQKRSLVQFKGLRLLLTAKNLKTRTQDPTWAGALEKFSQIWSNAVDPQYLEHEYFDVAKEDVSNKLTPPEEDNRVGSNRPVTPSSNGRERPQVVIHTALPLLSEDNPNGEIDYHSVTSNNNEDSNHNRSDPNYTDPSASRPVSPDNKASTGAANTRDPAKEYTGPKPCWKSTFYHQTLLRDMGSWTIEPHRYSLLRDNGLYYCQFYNSCKEVFAIGDHYPFSNPALDTLALDRNLVRTWGYIGQAISHNPTILLRAYCHTKKRYHTALQDYQRRAYGTREEFRVTGILLRAIDREMQAMGVAHQPLTLPPPALLSPTRPFPFFTYRTVDILGWYRWNINRFYLGFELVYNLRPHTLVHWEHNRVIIIFLKCLIYTFGGQGRSLPRYNGLWLNRRVQPPVRGTDQEQVQEGLSMGETLEHYGFAWFLDKLDWTAMTFRPPHRKVITSFNIPSMLSAYHRHYQELKVTQTDYLLIHDIFIRMLDSRADTARSAALLDLLINIYLQAFRQEVFNNIRTILRHIVRDGPQLQKALNSNMPLTLYGLRSIIRGDISQYLHATTDSRTNIRHIEVLFEYLWGWKTRKGDPKWERQWENKFYRTIYRQSCTIITEIYRLRQARDWQATLKYRFIRTHLVLPYPNGRAFWPLTTSKDPIKKLRTWMSWHNGLFSYYRHQRERQLTQGSIQHEAGANNVFFPVITPPEVLSLPTTGWTRSDISLDLQVQLPTILTDLDTYINAMGDPPSTGPIPLPFIPITDGPLAQWILEQSLPQRKLRSFIEENHLGTINQVHTNQNWLTKELPVVAKEQAEMEMVHIQALHAPLEKKRLSSVNQSTQGNPAYPLTTNKKEEDNSDPESLRQRIAAIRKKE